MVKKKKKTQNIKNPNPEIVISLSNLTVSITTIGKSECVQFLITTQIKSS